MANDIVKQLASNIWWSGFGWGLAAGVALGLILAGCVVYAVRR